MTLYSLLTVYRQIPASYRLQPSSCPLCVVCALPPDSDANKVKAAALEAVENAHLQLRYVPLRLLIDPEFNIVLQGESTACGPQGWSRTRHHLNYTPVSVSIVSYILVLFLVVYPVIVASVQIAHLHGFLMLFFYIPHTCSQ